MKKLTPIDFEGDSKVLFDALCDMFVRAAKMARKRPSPLDIAIPPAVVDVLVAMEDYFNETKSLDAVLERLSETFN